MKDRELRKELEARARLHPLHEKRADETREYILVSLLFVLFLVAALVAVWGW